MAENNTPKAICRAVGRWLSYRENVKKEWATGGTVWRAGTANCSGFASCVHELCGGARIESEIRLYYSTGALLGHAVVVGGSGACKWFSSNGGYEEAKSDDAVAERVARLMGWREKDVWSRPLSEEEYHRLVAG